MCFIRIASAALFVVASASASLIQVTLTGNISSSNESLFVVGQQATAQLVYESSGAPQFTANQQAFYVDQLRSFQITTAGWTSNLITGNFGQVNFNDGYAGYDGIGFVAAINTGYYSYTNPKPATVNLGSIFSNNVTQTFEQVGLVLEGAQGNNIWTGFPLPTTLDQSSFVNRNFTVGFSDGGFSVAGATLTAQDISSAPEPATISLIAGGLGYLAWRRRRRV